MGNDKFLSVAEIVEKMDSCYWFDRFDAMSECIDRTDIDVSLIENGLRDESWEVRVAAFNACVGRTDIDSKLLENWRCPQ